jgi:hypothetical protein
MVFADAEDVQADPIGELNLFKYGACAPPG